jgi:hypothetical protein
VGRRPVLDVKLVLGDVRDLVGLDLEVDLAAGGNLGEPDGLAPAQLAIAVVVDRGQLDVGQLAADAVEHRSVDDDLVTDAFPGELVLRELGGLDLLPEADPAQ